jgi:RNA polymerase sigma factor (sigma-70 family)
MSAKKKHCLTVNEVLLLQRISEGDWDAYTDLFNYYLPKLSQYIFPFANQSREDTEEVIQEVFLKIWEKKETLLTIRSFDHYIFRMAKNQLINLFNKRKAERNLLVKYATVHEWSHTETEQSLLYSEYHSAACKAIEQLSPKLKTVFLLSSQEQLSLDEISTKLDLPKETVKKRLYLAGYYIKNYLRLNAEWLLILSACIFFC